MAETGGGQAVVVEGEVQARLSLPIAGLMSTGTLKEVAESLDEVHAAARALGCELREPFTHLSFLALAVIPELKLTDHGLVDVGQFRLVPLEAEDMPPEAERT